MKAKYVVHDTRNEWHMGLRNPKNMEMTEKIEYDMANLEMRLKKIDVSKSN